MLIILLKVDVDKTTVLDLKKLISADPEAGFPVDDQILVYNGKTLTGGCGMEVWHANYYY